MKFRVTQLIKCIVVCTGVSLGLALQKGVAQDPKDLPQLSPEQRAIDLVDQPSHGVAQAITLRLLNAKTGRPMKNKMVTFLWEGQWHRTEIKSNDQGLGIVEVR